jgi:hypothetical protein
MDSGTAARDQCDGTLSPDARQDQPLSQDWLPKLNASALDEARQQEFRERPPPTQPPDSNTSHTTNSLPTTPAPRTSCQQDDSLQPCRTATLPAQLHPITHEQRRDQDCGMGAGQ